MSKELQAIASSLVMISDQLDRSGFSKSAEYLDKALEKFADSIELPEYDESSDLGRNIVSKAAKAALIRIADKLDLLKHPSVEDVDWALAALASETCGC
jgi:hypothetical protein